MLEEVNGFREAYSSNDCAFTVVQMIEKRREFVLSTFITFIDLKMFSISLNELKFEQDFLTHNKSSTAFIYTYIGLLKY
jgi:hypothetical protein